MYIRVEGDDVRKDLKTANSVFSSRYRVTWTRDEPWITMEVVNNLFIDKSERCFLHPDLRSGSALWQFMNRTGLALRLAFEAESTRNKEQD